jgi:hypothetical protein
MIGIIYKIICKTNDNIIYIGSTTLTIKQRWDRHISDYTGKNRNVSIYEYFDKYGFDNFEIILIKQYKVIDKVHLKAYEQLYINKYRKICVNKCNPFRIKYLSNKESNKKYREENKEEIKEYSKKYREENKEEIKVKGKKYREENKEEIKEYSEKYYEENKEKITCECGSIVTKCNLTKHKKTKKHLEYLKSIS